MMKINFTKKEKSNISSIINRYRDVTSELEDLRKKAFRIQNEMKYLENELSKIQDEEDTLLDVLHSKYGDFTLQDIYEEMMNV